MDLKPFKLDIDDLVTEFCRDESTTLDDMKRVWSSKRFSFIFEARPSTNLSCFMQSLYSHAIGGSNMELANRITGRLKLEFNYSTLEESPHLAIDTLEFFLGYMVSTTSLSHRLGGLYCLYCLYETQPFKPPFKIYLSLGELKRLKNLVVDAKEKDIKVASALVKNMLKRNLFLFGAVDLNEGSVSERVNELTNLQNARVAVANKKLFADTRIEQFIHMDMGMELDLGLLKKMSSDYAVAKELAIKEGGKVVDVQNIKHIAEDKRLIGEVVEDTIEDWNAQKELFYKKTGINKQPSEHVHQLKHNESFNRQEGNDNLELVEVNHNFGNEDDNTKEHGEDENHEGSENDDFGLELEKELLSATDFEHLED